MVRNTLQAMLCLFCLLWSRIIVGKGCNDKRKSGGVFWEGGLLVSVVDIVYVNLYFMLVCLMTRGEGGECFRRWVGGRATSRVGKVARSWLSPFYSCKIPRLLSHPRYSLVGAYSTSVDETDKMRILRRNRDCGQRAEHICGIVHTSTMANSIMDLLTQMPKRWPQPPKAPRAKNFLEGSMLFSVKI